MKGLLDDWKTVDTGRATNDQVHKQILWCASSWSESFRLLVQQAENTSSGQGPFR